MIDNTNKTDGGVVVRLPTWVPQYLPIIVLVATGIWATAELTRDVEDIASKITAIEAGQAQKWEDHASMHRDRAVENTNSFSRIDERLASVEQLGPKVDQITYRTTVLEQQAVSTSNAIKELQTTINSLSADVRITVEILRRMEERNGSLPLGPPNPGARN